MNYEDMINGLAEEMLEKIANEIDEEEAFEESVMEEVEELTEEEIEQLAEEMYMEELQKLAGYEEVEEYEELEKEAGLSRSHVKALSNKAVNEFKKSKAGQKIMNSEAVRGYNTAKINKELVEKALGGKVDANNPALKKYKKERNKLIAGAAGVGTAGVAAGAGAVAYGRKKVQEKAASYFEEAEFLKQAAEEAYQEAIMMQDAAVQLYNRMEEEE